RRDTILSQLMHVTGADLHFDRPSAEAHHRGVQRLVHAVLGIRNVVVELARYWPPQVVYDAEGVVAIVDRLYEHAERQQVVDFVEALTLRLVARHLLIDAEDVLRATLHFRGDVVLGKLLVEDRLDLADVLLARPAFRRDELG